MLCISQTQWRRRFLPQSVSIDNRYILGNGHSLAGLGHAHSIWEVGHPQVWYPEGFQEILVEPCHGPLGQ